MTSRRSFCIAAFLVFGSFIAFLILLDGWLLRPTSTLSVTPLDNLSRQLSFIFLNARYGSSDGDRLSCPSIVRRPQSDPGYDVCSGTKASAGQALFKVDPSLREVTWSGFLPLKSVSFHGRGAGGREEGCHQRPPQLFVDATDGQTKAVVEAGCTVRGDSQTRDCLLCAPFSGIRREEDICVALKSATRARCWAPVIGEDGLCPRLFVSSYFPQLCVMLLEGPDLSGEQVILRGPGTRQPLDASSPALYLPALGAFVGIARVQDWTAQLRRSCMHCFVIMEATWNPASGKLLPSAVLRESDPWKILVASSSLTAKTENEKKHETVGSLCLGPARGELILAYVQDDCSARLATFSTSSLLEKVRLRLLSPDAFYINREKDSERRKFFEASSSATGLNFLRWAAVDKEEVMRVYRARALTHALPRWSTMGVNPNEVLQKEEREPLRLSVASSSWHTADRWALLACSFSHLDLWAHIAGLKEDQWYVICEDDCSFKLPLQHATWHALVKDLLLRLPEDADILFLGTQEVPGHSEQPWVKQTSWCLHCYAIHPASARLLLDAAAKFGTGKAIDFLTRDLGTTFSSPYCVSDAYLRKRMLVQQPEQTQVQLKKDMGLAYQDSAFETSLG